jgi:riboflavin biosynthesis pyrimidine reductase
LPHDPLAVIVSGSMDLPFDAPLFTDGGGRVLIFTENPDPPPETATSLSVVRSEGPIDIRLVLRHLRHELGTRAVLCEGGPILLGQLEAAAAVDDLFLTISPELVGGGASPRILEGVLEEPRRKKLEQLLEHDGELFARYGRR